VTGVNGGRAARVRPTREQTRRRVLDAAFAVFSEHGIAASSLADVAEAAGLTKGAIYSSFAGKDELVLALMEERVLDRLAAAIGEFDAVPDHRQGAVAAGRVVAEATREDPAPHRLLMEYFATTHRDPARREGLRRRRREAREAVGRALTRLRDESGVRLPLPPEETAVVLMALSNGLAIEGGIDPEAVPPDLLGRLLGAMVGEGSADGRPGREG
jgi:AcrR family transcriptional regulator